MTINDANTPPTQETATEEVTALPPESSAQDLPPEPQELTPEQRRTMIAMIVVLILVIALILGSIFWLANQPPLKVAMIRDIFIIWMAIMSLLVSLVLVILMVQMARLINLLQNEIKPILDSINQTTSHVRGTSVFLGDNLTEPVIKANEYIAGFAQFLSVLRLARRPTKSSSSKNPKESE